MGVAGAVHHEEGALLRVEPQQRDVERAPAKVKDEDDPVALVLVEFVGDRCGDGLLDQTDEGEPRAVGGADRGGLLLLAEADGDGHGDALELEAEQPPEGAPAPLRRRLEPPQEPGGDLLRRNVPPLHCRDSTALFVLSNSILQRFSLLSDDRTVVFQPYETFGGIDDVPRKYILKIMRACSNSHRAWWYRLRGTPAGDSRGVEVHH
mmetsp:Transcript_1306/g.3107  ORF Transcript_1306/g.3107 Transcript_1306/m.3107 type:complete len:207 (+) Transcript_1306:613-1233(+)